MKANGSANGNTGTNSRSKGSRLVRSPQDIAYSFPTASTGTPALSQRTWRNATMFGLIAKRHDSHYRQAMRELQPFATETNSLWLSGYYRGVNVLVPFAPKPAYAQQQRRQDY